MQIRGHIIELDPNNIQATYFKKACGVARLAYNWALAEWQRQYQCDKDYKEYCDEFGLNLYENRLFKPTMLKLKKQFNAIKKEKYPFVFEVSKCSTEQGIMQLGNAFKRFFKGESAYPKFRKKGINDRFSLDNCNFKIKTINNKPYIQIAKLGLVRMRENLRFNGKVLSAKIFTRGGKWFVSIAVELSEVILPQPKTNQSVGIDLGITDLATLSIGEKIQAPNPLKNKLKKLKRLNTSLSRKQKGSSNFKKAKTKLSKLHYQIACIRKDFTHKLTTNLIKRFDE